MSGICLLKSHRKFPLIIELENSSQRFRRAKSNSVVSYHSDVLSSFKSLFFVRVNGCESWSEITLKQMENEQVLQNTTRSRFSCCNSVFSSFLRFKTRRKGGSYENQKDENVVLELNDETRVVGPIKLSIIAFFMTCGGPFGIEEAVLFFKSSKKYHS